MFYECGCWPRSSECTYSPKTRRILISVTGKAEFRISEEFCKAAGPVLVFGVEVARPAACSWLTGVSCFEFEQQRVCLHIYQSMHV